MIVADLPPIWLPPKPAIIRPVEHALLRPGAFAPGMPAERRAIIADLVRSKRLTSVDAKTAMFFVPPAMWTSAPLVATYITHAETDTGTANPSFSVSFGTAAANRYILVGWWFESSNTTNSISSATIGGVAATQPVTAATGSREFVGFTVALVPTGTSGTVAATLGSAMQHLGITVWALTGLQSTTAIAGSTDSAITTSSSGQTLGGTVPAGATLFGVGGWHFSGGTAIAHAAAHAAVAANDSASVTFAPTSGATAWSGDIVQDQKTQNTTAGSSVGQASMIMALR